MKAIYSLLILFPLLFIAGCGEPDVEITNSQYQPRIAVEGYLYCNEPVKDIRLTRNFMLGSSLDADKIILTPQQNNVVVTINGTQLNFDPVKKTYFNNNLVVEFGKTYQLDVTATIDGMQLHTTSKTTSPQKGFSVLKNNLGIIKYRSATPTIEFIPSPGTNTYVFSIIPDSAGIKNFIYDNPYEPQKDTTDLVDNFNLYRFQYDMLKDINSYYSKTYNYKIEGYNSWFYGSYTVTVYAADINFGYYLLTANNVKEMDGNFHEPIQIFEGDGIGVFGSAVKETVKFVLTK